MDYNRSTLGKKYKILERKKLINFEKGKDKREVEITMSNDGIKIFKIAEQSWENINNKTTIYLGKNKKNVRTNFE